MYKIRTYNKIADEGIMILNEKFSITQDKDSDGILLRSFSLQEEHIPPSVRAIARVGVGTNNIPVNHCTDHGIVVFNTPGANANAVKELAISALLLSSRNIIGGINWAKNLEGPDIAAQVEKGKSLFTGPELYGKKLGIIGLGAIGVMVANTAIELGMTVYGYDPYISIDAAWGLSKDVRKAADIRSLYAESDYLSIHIPMSKINSGFINKDSINSMKSGVRIINLSRGELVNHIDMSEALESGQVSAYVTDFPNDATAIMKNTIAIPHLGASTPESEINCAIMAVKTLKEFLLNGNITNSINFPSAELSRTSDFRLTFCHKNIPNILSQISGSVASEDINILNLINKSKDTIAYTILDIDQCVSDETILRLNQIDGMIRVRSI